MQGNDADKAVNTGVQGGFDIRTDLALEQIQVYKEHLTLQRTVGLDNVGDLNRAIEKGMTSEVVMVSEAMQERCV